MKQPKDFDPRLWNEFQYYIDELKADGSVLAPGLEEMLWDAWQDGYSFSIPSDSEINEDYMKQRQKEVLAAKKVI